MTTVLVRVAVVGCRRYTDYPTFRKLVDKALENLPSSVHILSGGARGVDSLAERYALEHKIPCTVVKADWARYGDRAGPIRNRALLRLSDRVLAFPSARSIGTYDTIRQAKAMKKPVTVVPLTVHRKKPASKTPPTIDVTQESSCHHACSAPK